MADDRGQIIIKKVKKGGHGGHHGGAWKIAYADFVTAMMAFFLLLWLLNATTEEQKLGIADYFAPTIVTGSRAGADGVLGGNTITVDGSLKNDTSPIGVTIALPSADQEWEGETLGIMATGSEEEEPVEEEQARDSQSPKEPAEPEPVEAVLKREEERNFEQAEAEIRQTLEESPDLKDLADNLKIDQTPEGLRIQIIDKDKTAMFPSGSSTMFEHTRRLMEAVVKAIAPLENRIAIKGHTDATPFNSSNGYSNWELSTERANASRRALMNAGLPETRIESVVGRAAQEPFLEEDPYAPQNRRISIILLRNTPLVELPKFQSGD